MRPLLDRVSISIGITLLLLPAQAGTLEAQIADTLGATELRGRLTLTPILFERRTSTGPCCGSWPESKPCPSGSRFRR